MMKDQTLQSTATRRVSPYFKTRDESPHSATKTQKFSKEQLKLPRSARPENLPLLNDCLSDDLDILFVGINPGIASSTQGHHYAGRNNHFWPCLSESGLVTKPVSFKDDHDFPRLYKIGFTNMAQRPTRGQDDLNKKELIQGVPVLREKIARHQPKIVAFVGKGIYEVFSGTKCKELGLQTQTINSKTLVFCMPSTSSRTAAYQKADKLALFKQLAQLRDKLSK
jgi:mismatch-specific thymine-DNA glycosylase